jgi:hypothetical protein
LPRKKVPRPNGRVLQQFLINNFCMLSEKLLTLREACRGLGVHPNTLRKWGRQGIDVNEKSIDLAVIKPGKVRFGI